MQACKHLCVCVHACECRKFSSVQSLSHVQLFATPCCSMPGLPVHHQLLESTQTHVHWVGDATQPFHPLSRPLLLLTSISPSIRVFSNESALHIRWPKYWSFSFNSSPPKKKTGPIGTSCSPRDSQIESSPTPQFKNINSSALSFLYGPTLTSTHDYWKNHSFD